ncbi:thiamine transport system substrate-binding protein [Crossiella equi]|uniref:Thiamine transport system substrate-binding protein n=1 Tax=Crossiella equi TaxID=130796 RepID=A0ABS5AJN6_9PSEU|nr:thiamine ABC transporter substrate-binding protein [Crossiella equi]MBP2476424.1 thiamine transport system substrate-binding protein [Crossiella equi]
MLRRSLAAFALVTSLGLVSGCSLVGGSGSAPSGPGEAKVVLLTHDSFAIGEGLFAEFKAQTGITVEQRPLGDAGALTNQLVLTKTSPLGDVVFGVDSTFASRALDNGLFEPYKSPEAAKGPQRYAVDEAGALTAVDLGDVCLNTDIGYFAQKNLPEPRNLEDLADPRYKDLLVVTDPATSSPGLAFLLHTVATYGEDGWAGYWGRLKANGVKVVNGWDTAYKQEFTVGGKGTRPIVLSYASSPAAEVADGKPKTRALLNTCYRQVEYTGVLRGAKQPEAARKLVDFLLGEKFQGQVADQMYVYPAREGIALPSVWQQVAPQPTTAATVPAAQVAANRERWVEQWRQLVQG